MSEQFVTVYRCCCFQIESNLLFIAGPWHVVNAAALEAGVVPTGVPTATSSE